jgi:hypothetical protein
MTGVHNKDFSRIFLACVSVMLAVLVYAGAAGKFTQRPAQRRLVSFEKQDWQQFTFEGFDLKLPPGMKKSAEGVLDPDAAYEQGVPYSYASFIPEQSERSPGFERFEVRIGVHANRERLSAQEYRQRKTAQLEKSRQLDVFSVRDVTAAGFKGVRDDIKVRDAGGARCLSRVILPYKDRFLVISALVGGEQMVPLYRESFDAITQGVTVSRHSPPPSLKPAKAQKPVKKIKLDEF